MGKQDTDDILTWKDSIKIAGINTIYATKKTGQSLADLTSSIVVTTVNDGKICIQNGDVHECLSTCGIAGDAVPVAGNIAAMACDTTNGIVYLFQGDYVNAGLSTVAIVPYIGTVASKGGKQMVKLGSEATNALIRDAAKKIANGHAYEKHIGEFKSIGISSKQEFADHIEKVMKNPTHTKNLKNDRIAYYDDKTNTLVVHNPSNHDLGSSFRPTNGIDYYNLLK